MGGLLHLVQRGGAWASCGPAQSPPRCTKCHSPPINSQCTNHFISIWWSLLYSFSVAIKGLNWWTYRPRSGWHVAVDVSHSVCRSVGEYCVNVNFTVAVWQVIQAAAWQIRWHLHNHLHMQLKYEITMTTNDKEWKQKQVVYKNFLLYWLVAWHSRRTSIRTFPVLRSTCSWRVTA